MGAVTEIAWAHSTFNAWWGCAKVSDGCKNCYAERDSKRYGFKIWGQDAERRTFGDKHWEDPVRWNRQAQKAGERRRVFCSSMADVFEDRRDLDAHRARLWSLIEATPWLDWMLLSKRPENMLRLAPTRWAERWPRNAWAGATAESQEQLIIRWPHLATLPASVRFLSCEPQLGPIELICNGCGGNVHDHLAGDQGGCSGWFPNWIITGGESGSSPRPYCEDWARSLIKQCRLAGIAPFVKQMGAYYCFGDEGRPHHRVFLKHLKGGDPDEWPDDLRVREFPKVRP